MNKSPKKVRGGRVATGFAPRGRAGTAIIALLPLGGLAISSVGCGGGTPRSEDQQVRAAMRMVGVEYSRYESAHNDQPPADEAAFKEFLDFQISKTPDYGVKSADELLANSRDGQPLTVVYGKKAAPPDQQDTPWAAYEQVGVDGKRLVVNTRGSVVELPGEEVAKVVGE